MTLWRMEWARLVRTRRLVALAAPFVFFGFAGPLTARYLEQIVQRVGGGVTVQFPEPTPADGIVQFSSNAQQIGLLVVLVVAAGAFAVDARPQIAMFLRTRVRSAWRLLAPRYVLSAAAACGAYLLGVAAAWYETTVLLGGLPAGGMLAGAAYGCVYLAFAVSVVAAAGAVVRGRSAAAVVAVAGLLSLPILGLVADVRPWLPSELVGALDVLAAGGGAGEYLRAAGVAVAASVGLLWFATWRLGRREI